MFIEPLLNHNIHRGWVEVICGPMFSGKTEELIRRLKRAKIASKKVAIFKPMVDMRYSADDVVSHDSSSIPSIRLNRAMEIMEYMADAEVIAVDEVQFFDDKIVDVIQYLAYKGKRIIAAGLDMDSDAKPVGDFARARDGDGCHARMARHQRLHRDGHAHLNSRRGGRHNHTF